MTRWQDAPWDQRPFREDEMREWDRTTLGAVEGLAFQTRALWLHIVRAAPKNLYPLLFLGGWQVRVLVFIAAFWLPVTLLTAFFKVLGIGA